MAESFPFLLQVKNLTLDFAHKRALNDVSINFVAGKTHALLGENGAGKSCLADILCGIKQPTDGTVLLNEKPVCFSSPAQALKAGIAVVRQRPVLAEKAKVWENLFLGYCEKENCFFADKKAVIKRLTELCREWNVMLEPELAVENATDVQRFYIALFTALLHNPVFLLLDEPSALLNADERKNFLACLEKKVSDGLGVVYITHNVKEASEYCSSVFVLRKGNLVATLENPNFQISEELILEKMFDTPVTSEPKPAEVTENNCTSSRVAFQVSNLYTFSKKSKNLKNLSFSACFGEITLVKINSRYALEDIITGMYKEKLNGRFYVDGVELFPFTAGRLRRAGVGIVSSRKYIRSSSPSLTVKELMIPFFAGRYDTRFRDSAAFAQNLVDSENIDISIDEPVSDLSGGMLQRLIFSREFSRRPRILILCEPLYGLDKSVSAKLEYSLRLLADSGVAVLILSSNTESSFGSYDKLYDFFYLDEKK